MRSLLSAALCALLLAATTPLATLADDTTQGENVSAAPAPPPPPPVTIASPRPAGQFAYGTHISAVDHASLASKDGFNLMWAYIPWQQVEPERGTYLFRQQDKWGKPVPNALSNVVSAAADNNMKLILRIDEVPAWAGGDPAHLDPSALEEYLYEAVRYGKGTIQYVEVFNEQNLPYEWGGQPDPYAYARLLSAAYRGVKRADSNVAVISAAPSQKTGGLGGSMEDVDWLNGLYQAGAANSFDLLGMHAYLGNFAPESDPAACSPMCFRDVERFRDVMVRNGDASKGAFITEMGALTQTSVDLGQYNWMELPADTRGDYLVRALQMANGNYPWIRGAMVFNFDYATVPWNPQTSERYWFSLTTSSPNGPIESLALQRFKQARSTGLLP
jgi:hypothetical protein